MSTFDDVCDISSFRNCRDDPVPRDTIGKILEAGRRAPSPGNVQSLEFIVVESEQKKEMLHRATDDKRVLEAPTLVIVLSDYERMRRHVGDEARDGCSGEAACAVQNMRIVASSEGVASCWISGFDKDMVAEKFGVPSGKKPEGIVMFAYTDNPVPSEERFGLNEICFYDEYGSQVNSFWDEPGWRGLRDESRIQGRKARGLVGMVKRKLRQLL